MISNPPIFGNARLMNRYTGTEICRNRKVQTVSVFVPIVTIVEDKPLSLPPNLDRAEAEFPLILSLPPTLDRAEAEFPVLQAIGRLGCPMDFLNSTGVLLPMALCGRSSLYSLR